MNANYRIIIKEVVVLSSIAATIFISGEQITDTIFNTFGFIAHINHNMGWVVLGLASVWLICRLKGFYKWFDHPFFYASFIYWLFFWFGKIEPSWGLNITMAAIGIPLIWHIGNFAIKWIKNYKKTESNQSIFTYDHFEDGKSLHEGRTEMVNLITTQVKQLYNTKHSFTIGIEGGWGTGKTTLLDRITENLNGKQDEHKQTIEIIKFTPWAFPDGKNLSVEFLYEIRKMLIKHSFKARFVINSYINVLAGDNSMGLLRILTNLIFPRESLTDVKRKLSEIICFHKLKLVVVIDDLDRLDEPEIVEVFKMLRNTGELANAVYLVAYDRLNIEKMDKFANGYLDKIINMEVDLNRFNSQILFDKLLIKLEPELNKGGYTLNDNGVCCIRDLYKFDIIDWIENERMVLKLVNSIKFRLRLYTEIGISDKIKLSYLILIELVRLKKIDAYNTLYKVKQVYNSHNQDYTEINAFTEILPKDKTLKKTWLQFISSDIDYYLLKNTEQVEILNLIAEYNEEKENDITELLAKHENNTENFELIVRRLKLSLMQPIRRLNRIGQIISNETYFKKLSNDIVNYYTNRNIDQIIIPEIPATNSLCLLDKTMLLIYKNIDNITFLNNSDSNLNETKSTYVNIESYFADRIKNSNYNFSLAYQLLINLNFHKPNVLSDSNYKHFKQSFSKSLKNYIQEDEFKFGLNYAFNTIEINNSIKAIPNEILTKYFPSEMNYFSKTENNNIYKNAILFGLEIPNEIFKQFQTPRDIYRKRQTLEINLTENGNFFEFTCE